MTLKTDIEEMKTKLQNSMEFLKLEVQSQYAIQKEAQDKINKLRKKQAEIREKFQGMKEAVNIANGVSTFEEINEQNIESVLESIKYSV